MKRITALQTERYHADPSPVRLQCDQPAARTAQRCGVRLVEYTVLRTAELRYSHPSTGDDATGQAARAADLLAAGRAAVVYLGARRGDILVEIESHLLGREVALAHPQQRDVAPLVHANHLRVELYLADATPALDLLLNDLRVAVANLLFLGAFAVDHRFHFAQVLNHMVRRQYPACGARLGVAADHRTGPLHR